MLLIPNTQKSPALFVIQLRLMLIDKSQKGDINILSTHCYSSAIWAMDALRASYRGFVVLSRGQHSSFTQFPGENTSNPFSAICGGFFRKEKTSHDFSSKLFLRSFLCVCSSANWRYVFVQTFPVPQSLSLTLAVCSNLTCLLHHLAGRYIPFPPVFQTLFCHCYWKFLVFAAASPKNFSFFLSATFWVCVAVESVWWHPFIHVMASVLTVICVGGREKLLSHTSASSYS